MVGLVVMVGNDHKVYLSLCIMSICVSELKLERQACVLIRNDGISPSQMQTNVLWYALCGHQQFRYTRRAHTQTQRHHSIRSAVTLFAFLSFSATITSMCL